MAFRTSFHYCSPFPREVKNSDEQFVRGDVITRKDLADIVGWCYVQIDYLNTQILQRKEERWQEKVRYNVHATTQPFISSLIATPDLSFQVLCLTPRYLSHLSSLKDQSGCTCSICIYQHTESVQYYEYGFV